MKNLALSVVVMLTAGVCSLTNALGIDPGSVHAVVEGKVYRGGMTTKKGPGIYGASIDDFSYPCAQGFDVVVNAYTNNAAKTITCPNGRTITYLGNHWSSGKQSAADAFVADEIRRQAKILVHCVNGVDASQQVAYIVAAKAGLMSAQEAAARFVKAPAGVPHAGKMEGYVLSRGQ